MSETALGNVLAANTREGELWKTLPDGRIECFACGHRCPIPEGRAGICKVRFNDHGKLKVPFGYVAGIQDDPVEKKPFYHMLPGARALSFGMLGCDYHCAYCQNWVTSQALRDPAALAQPSVISADRLVKLALDRKCEIVVSTYNEPLITSEWSVAVFREAKKHGLFTAYVSNGNATPEVLDYILPWIDCYKIDLKSFSEKNYRELGGELKNVLYTIREIFKRGTWLEIVTLLIPGYNDSEEEITGLTEFLASVSPAIPWHVTAYHPDYKMHDHERTAAEHLMKAVRTGEKSGLQYIYAGNLPGSVSRYENTLCPGCGETLIERTGFTVTGDRLSAAEGSCPGCGQKIPGFWKPGRSAGPGRIVPLV